MATNQPNTSFAAATGKLDYRLTNDCMFHIVFQKNPKALLGLCASLLHMHPEDIRSVEVLNPLEFKDLPTDKQFVLDLKVMLGDERILNFEVQVIDENDWIERSLTYACRTFDQLQKGQTYLDVKPVYHIGFLDYTLKGFTPEFYATYKLLNVKNHEMYSDKLSISVVNLNQIELATEEDRKYGIDHWARLFKATTWEAIKLLAKENEYISSAAETMYESSQDKSMRFFLEGVEEANRIRRGQEIRLERAAEELQAKENRIAQMNDTLAKLDASLAEKAVALAEKDSALAEKDSALVEKDSALAEKDSALAEKDAEIVRLKEQLAALTK